MGTPLCSLDCDALTTTLCVIGAVWVMCTALSVLGLVRSMIRLPKHLRKG